MRPNHFVRPLDTVKFDLAIILVIGLLMLLVIARLTGNWGTQVLVLALYGCGGLLWIVIRTRRVLARWQAETGHGQE